MAKWRFVTNHALVLIQVAQHPRSTLREIALAVGITERAALSILRAMEEDEIISRKKEGRRNKYWVDFRALLDHPLGGPYPLAELMEALTEIGKQISTVQRVS